MKIDFTDDELMETIAALQDHADDLRARADLAPARDSYDAAYSRTRAAICDALRNRLENL